MPGARVLATDIARDALDVAKENATTHKVQDRVELLQGDCLAPLLAHTLTSAGCAINYLVSNPPYIPDDEWPDKVDRNVRDHEPHVALRGGADGLALVRPIILGAGALLASGGFMMVEVADARADEALAIAQSSDALKDASIVKDVEGLKRFVRALRA
jgi:release factor glutamine methyltransferase